MSERPGVVLAIQFKQPGEVKDSYYADGLEYTNREEAFQSQYGKYQDYMNNEEKTTGLFHAFSEELTLIEKEFYKRKFNEAQVKGGLLWQPIP